MSRVFTAILLSAALVFPASAGALSTTTVTIFEGFTAKGAPAIRVHRESGSCFSGSLASDRADAWRCTFANNIADPCFSSAHAHGLVVCPGENPDSGIEIKLTAALPSDEANHGAPSATAQPWALKLPSGQYCDFSGGATSTIGGVRANYYCSGSGEDWLWGLPLRTTQPWTIGIASINATSLSQTTPISHAWT